MINRTSNVLFLVLLGECCDLWIVEEILYYRAERQATRGEVSHITFSLLIGCIHNSFGRQKGCHGSLAENEMQINNRSFYCVCVCVCVCVCLSLCLYASESCVVWVCVSVEFRYWEGWGTKSGSHFHMNKNSLGCPGCYSVSLRALVSSYRCHGFSAQRHWWQLLVNTTYTFN